MPRMTFIDADGKALEVEATLGHSLLQIAWDNGIDIEGACEGAMACSTCHVIVSKEWFARLGPASEDEEDMLDLAADVHASSRLSCQILLNEELDGIEVSIPRDSYDMRGR